MSATRPAFALFALWTMLRWLAGCSGGPKAVEPTATVAAPMMPPMRTETPDFPAK